MKKNVASQVVAAQLVSSTDGSAVTSGTTTVYVLGDGGTQGSGSGTVTHEGNGCWSYAPTQAETNYDHVAFTFVNSSAVSVTVNVYPTFPQTGDTYALANGATGFTAIDTVVDAIKAVTDNLPDSGALSSLATASALATAQADLDTLTGTDGVTLATSQPNYAPATAAALATVDGNVDLILEDTGTTIPGLIAALNDLDSSAVQTAAAAALTAYDPPTQTELTAAFTEIKGGTWSSVTDTLEAIRDRGDAAWTTATGFSTHSAADVWAVGTRALTDKAGFSLASTGLDLVTAWTVAITGNLSGSVGSVTGGINTAAGTITTLDALDTAQDAQHTTTQGLVTTVDTVADAIKAKTDNVVQIGTSYRYTQDASNAGNLTADVTITAVP